MRTVGGLLVAIGVVGFLVAVLGKYIGIVDAPFGKTHVVAVALSAFLIIAGSGVLGRARA